MKHKIVFFAIVLFLLPVSFLKAVSSSDTILLSVADAENYFIQRNLVLLAANYDIESSKALIMQAKLWPNPSIEIQQGFYDPNTNRYLDASKTGQSSVQIEQLIYLAGKRNKQVSLQKINSALAEAQLYDLLRTLKFELRSIAFDMYYKQRTLLMYESQITSLKKTVQLYQNQYLKGAISSREMIRLQAFLASLENEKYGISRAVHQDLQALYTLMGDTVRPYYIIELPEGYADSFSNQLYSLDSLYTVALTSRSDIRILQLEIDQNRQIRTLERANAYPNMYVGGIWDRQSNYIPNYTGLIIGFDLPVFNRNQGGIKIAQNNYEKSLLNLTYGEQVVMDEVLTAYRQVSDFNSLYKNPSHNLIKRFEEAIDASIASYEKRSITLIDFIDFYEAYKEYITSIYELRGNRLHAIEYLNFTTGVDVYEFR